MIKEKVKRNTLTRIEVLQMPLKLASHKNELQNKTREEALLRINEIIGRELSPTAFKDISQALELKFKRVKNQGKGGVNLMTRVAALSRELQETKARLDAIEEIVTR